MHHAYECTATFLTCVYSGATVAFSRGLKYIRKDILEVQPTIMLAVPAIIENFYNKILKAVREKGGEKNLQKFMIMNREARRFKLKLPKSVTKDIVALFGGRLHTLISGGAAIDGAILDFFCNVGFRAIQGYGLTECSPIVALNPVKRKYMKNASAGHVIPFTECKILDADSNGIGEICFRGPTIMMGYYKDPENTAEVIDEEGWFHTGDIGYLDRDRYVFITGRKKNVIIASNGKNVFPEELESYLLALPIVEECMVWGGELDPNSPWNGIHATIRLDKEEVAAVLGDDYTPEQAKALIEAEVDKINNSMPRFKKIVHVIVREREFDKTTSMKIRRFVEDNKHE
jgi:long-chain acyl-CoA synthetase